MGAWDGSDSRDRWRTTVISQSHVTGHESSGIRQTNEGWHHSSRLQRLAATTGDLHCGTAAGAPCATVKVCSRGSKHSADGASPHIHQLVMSEMKIRTRAEVLPGMKLASWHPAPAGREAVEATPDSSRLGGKSWLGSGER